MKKAFVSLFILLLFMSCKVTNIDIPETIEYPSWFVKGTYVDDDNINRFTFQKDYVSWCVNTLNFCITVDVKDIEILHSVPGDYTGFTIRYIDDTGIVSFHIYKEEKRYDTVEINSVVTTYNGSVVKKNFGWCDLL